MKQEVSQAIEVRLNGQPIQDSGFMIDQLMASPFKDFIDGLNKALSKKEQVITGIQVNGTTLTLDEEQKIQELNLKEVGAVDIFTSTPVDLAYETLNTLDQYVERIIFTIDRAALHYDENNIAAGDAYFVSAIDGLDLFVQTVGGIKMALKIGLSTKVGLAEATLMSTMNELLMTKKQNNYKFMAELLRKDLIENLNEWKNEVFPIFRNWKVS